MAPTALMQVYLKGERTLLGLRLGISYETVEKNESGKTIIDEEKLEKILKGKGVCLQKKFKTVSSNQDRRSYKRIITKEVRVLKILRLMKNLTQDQASAICGYSRPSIGHIENGRIELDEDRIRHIVSSYGFEFQKFEELMKEEVLRDTGTVIVFALLGTLAFFAIRGIVGLYNCKQGHSPELCL